MIGVLDMDSPKDNQTNNDVSQQSDVATGQPAGTNQAGTNVSVPAGTTDTSKVIDQTAVAGDTKDKTDEGTVTRLQQQLAQNNKLLQTLGIEPDSDIAERFNAGLIGKQELLEYAGIAPVPPTTQAETPEQRLANIIEKAKREGATQEDFIAAMETVGGIVKAQKEQAERSNLSNRLNECIAVVTNAIEQDDLHKDLPADLQEIETQMFLTSTDNIVMRDAKKYSRSESDYVKYLTPASYGFYADKNIERLGKLRDYYIELGRKLQRGDQMPRTTNVNPISPSVGTGPTAPPVPQITRDNWKEAARRYVAQQGTI
jgi:hypothetical protein